MGQHNNKKKNNLRRLSIHKIRASDELADLGMAHEPVREGYRQLLLDRHGQVRIEGHEHKVADDEVDPLIGERLDFCGYSVHS
jgi:hypothetical protein